MKKHKKYFSAAIIALLIIVIGFTIPYAKKMKNTPKMDVSHTFTGKQQALAPKVSMNLTKTSGSGACEDMRAEIDMLFEKARICQEDSDCIIEDKGMFCPFGCYQIHNKNYDITQIMEKVMKFQESKCFLCEYSCMPLPAQSDVKCQENRCVDARYSSNK